MFAEFFSKLSKSEQGLARSLTTPEKIQAFLDSIPYTIDALFRWYTIV